MNNNEILAFELTIEQVIGLLLNALDDEEHALAAGYGKVIDTLRAELKKNTKGE